MGSHAQSKDHLGSHAHPVGTLYSQAKMKSPPPYNSIHRNSWKGSQESLNMPKRPESPLTRESFSGNLTTPRTSSPVTTTLEVPSVKWEVSKKDSQGMQQRYCSVPHSVAASSQGRQTGVNPRMLMGWKPAPPQNQPPSQYPPQQGLPPQNLPPHSHAGSALPQPQFQVTAQVNLSTSTNRNEVYQPSKTYTSSAGGNRNTASPMSFHVQVHTNVASPPSGNPPPQMSPQTLRDLQTRRAQNSHGSREGSGDSQAHQCRHSPVFKTHNQCLPQIGLPPQSENTIPYFVQSFDPKSQPPPYAPVAQRPLSGTSGIGSDTTSTLGCPSLSSVSSQSYLSSPKTNETWRHSWNTEASSNSSMSDEQTFASSVYDSGPPSPFSDSSYNAMETPMVATTIQNMGGAVINYNFDTFKVRTDEGMRSYQESMDLDDDEGSLSSEENSVPTSRQKLEACKGKIKNYTPEAFKFFMEQHVENVMKSREERAQRRAQLEAEMAKVGLSEEAQLQMREILKQKETNYIRLKRTKMGINMFEKIKMIGIGAFGEVWLVRKTDTNMLHAMKILRKTDVLRRNQAAHVKAERDILAEADNEWFVKLYYSFQDREFLYFVMDYIPGGDLMSLLIKFGIFPEDYARFYIAELVLAIESVHRMGFGHRDIKPDNILIDKDGHIKLTDFGLCTGFRWTHDSKYYQKTQHARQDSVEPDEREWEAIKAHCLCGDICVDKPYNEMKPLERRHFRKHMRCQAHSLVGTPNYIAPEVLLRIGYTKDCDWWSVGVILYEMLVGQPPFLAPTPAETQLKVCTIYGVISIMTYYTTILPYLQVV